MKTITLVCTTCGDNSPMHMVLTVDKAMVARWLFELMRVKADPMMDSAILKTTTAIYSTLDEDEVRGAVSEYPYGDEFVKTTPEGGKALQELASDQEVGVEDPRIQIFGDYAVFIAKSDGVEFEARRLDEKALTDLFTELC